MGKSTLIAQVSTMTRAQMACQNSMCTSSPRLAPASPPSPPRRLSSTPPPTARFDAWPPLLKWRAGLPAMCTSCGKLLPSLCRWRADTGRGDADPPPLPAPASSPSTLRNARCALLLPRTHRSREERQVHTSQGAAHRARDAKTKRTERRCCRGIVAWRPHRQPQRRLTQRAAALQLQWQHRNVGQHHEVEEMEEYLGNASRTFVPRYVGQRPAAVHLHLDSIAAYFHGIHHRCNTTINGDLQRHRVCPSTPPRNASEATHAQHMHT